jgi:hypothetical protein
MRWQQQRSLLQCLDKWHGRTAAELTRIFLLGFGLMRAITYLGFPGKKAECADSFAILKGLSRTDLYSPGPARSSAYEAE